MFHQSHLGEVTGREVIAGDHDRPPAPRLPLQLSFPYIKPNEITYPIIRKAFWIWILVESR